MGIARSLLPRGGKRSTLGAIAAVTSVILIISVERSGGFFSGPEGPWLFFADDRPKAVSLPLLKDPAGLIIIAAMLASPFFCMSQVRCISTFVTDNTKNVDAAVVRALGTDAHVEILGAIQTANTSFRRIGAWWSSLIRLPISVAAASALYSLLVHHGVYTTWNPTRLPDDQWRQRAYEGWWMNWDSHRPAALVMIGLTSYFFYNLSKQLQMGLAFVRYAGRANRAGFAVAPNLRVNTDGHQGLRPLRAFISWTYTSTVINFILTLAVLMVWLPFTAWTVYIEAAVVVFDVTFALWPSVIAVNGIVREKTRYAEELWSIAESRNDDAARAHARAGIEVVWAGPHLPFKLRSALSAGTLYFLIPAALAVFSLLIGGKS